MSARKVNSKRPSKHVANKSSNLKLNAKPIPSTSRSKICLSRIDSGGCVQEKKHFIDTIKLIAYRAETALAELAREKIRRCDDARSLIRQLFRTEIDLIPDRLKQTLTVRLHPMSTQVHDEVVHHIIQELTQTETVFPGTDLRLVYEISGSPKFLEIRMSESTQS